MEDKTLFELINPPFCISFAGKEYNIRKANLEKAILYQAKLRELVTQNDSATDLKIAAYCLYLVLSEVDAMITEDYIIKNAPASFNPLEWIEMLGFTTPQKRLEMAKDRAK